MRPCLLDVARLAGQDEGCRQCRNPDAEIQQSVAVCDEGVGVWGVVCVLDVGAGRFGRVGEVIFGFGVEVVGGAGASGAGVGSDGVGWLGEVGVGLCQDAVVVDCSDFGAGRGFGL